MHVRWAHRKSTVANGIAGVAQVMEVNNKRIKVI
jgi:hypothetical protein